MHVAFVIKINLVMFLKNSIRETWNSSFNVFFLVEMVLNRVDFCHSIFFIQIIMKELVLTLAKSSFGGYMSEMYSGIFVYVDDINLSISVNGLNFML